MSELINTKRIKSLAWRVGMMMLAGGLAYLSENVGLLELSTEVTVILGLVFGEISKAIHNILHK